MRVESQARKAPLSAFVVLALVLAVAADCPARAQGVPVLPGGVRAPSGPLVRAVARRLSRLASVPRVIPSAASRVLVQAPALPVLTPATVRVAPADHGLHPVLIDLPPPC